MNTYFEKKISYILIKVKIYSSMFKHIRRYHLLIYEGYLLTSLPALGAKMDLEKAITYIMQGSSFFKDRH